MSDRTTAERQANLRRRRNERGEVQVLVWVHESNRERIKAIARELLEPAAPEKKG